MKYLLFSISAILLIGIMLIPDIWAETCDFDPEQREFDIEPYYTGPLLDAHFHMPAAFAPPPVVAHELPYEIAVFDDHVSKDGLICMLDKQNIKSVIGFYPVLDNLPLDSIKDMKYFEEKHPDRVNAFLLPISISQWMKDEWPVLPGQDLEQYLEMLPFTKGYGEFAFYLEVYERQGEHLEADDPEMIETYEILEKRNMIFMSHPGNRDMPALLKMIEKYPNIIFLFHGEEIKKPQLSQILEKYTNVYYSLDYNMISNCCLHNNPQTDSKETFLPKYRDTFEQTMKDELRIWKPIIEKHPDKIMWGTDILKPWHIDEEVQPLLIEMSRSFIGGLDPAVQEKYAYKNAERMLGMVKTTQLPVDTAIPAWIYFHTWVNNLIQLLISNVIIGASTIVAAIVGIVFAVRRRSGGTKRPKPARQDLEDYEEQYLQRQGQRPRRRHAKSRPTSSSCNSCGKPLKPTVKFCGSCGTRID